MYKPWCVVHKDEPNKIIRRFEEKGEALAFITDRYAHESIDYFVLFTKEGEVI